jgi:hypothetical protein
MYLLTEKLHINKGAKIVFIRLFAHSTNEDDSKRIFNEMLSFERDNIDKIEYLVIEPYWKIDGLYKLEANLNFKIAFTEERITKFLNSISDKWTFFGNPIEEALASETTEGCIYIKNGVNMVNIFF